MSIARTASNRLDRVDGNSMDDFYQRHAKAYAEQTFHIDPSAFLMPLLKYLKRGNVLLDAGCGAGRDMLWFKKRGFTVIGFERSAALAAIARENTGCDVIEGDFERYDFHSLCVDAILLVGALVHLPPERAQASLRNICPGLDAAGKLLVSLKEGKGVQKCPDGRRFYLWRHADLSMLFSQSGLTVTHFQRQVSAVRLTDTWLSYVLMKS